MSNNFLREGGENFIDYPKNEKTIETPLSKSEKIQAIIRRQFSNLYSLAEDMVLPSVKINNLATTLDFANIHGLDVSTQDDLELVSDFLENIGISEGESFCGKLEENAVRVMFDLYQDAYEVHSQLAIIVLDVIVERLEKLYSEHGFAYLLDNIAILQVVDFSELTLARVYLLLRLIDEIPNLRHVPEEKLEEIRESFHAKENSCAVDDIEEIEGM